MPRVSKNNIISNQEIDRIENEFYSLLSSLRGNALKDFMNDFLSDEERGMLAKRLELYLLLHMDLDYQTISSSLSISQETVRVHKTKRRLHGKVFHEVIQNIIKKRRNDKLLSDIGSAAGSILSVPYKMKSRRFASEVHGNSPKK